MNHYEQFTAMLDNAQRMRPVVFKRKSISLTKDPKYNVVEMESAAGNILFGFSNDTGELMDVIGPCRRDSEAKHSGGVPTPTIRMSRAHTACRVTTDTGATG